MIWNYLWIAYASIVPIYYGLKGYRRHWQRKLEAFKAELAYLDEGHKYHPWHTVEHPVADVQFIGERFNRPLVLWDTHDMVVDISKTTLN